MNPRTALAAATLSLAAVAAPVATSGCTEARPVAAFSRPPTAPAAPRLLLDPSATITVPGVGAGQGVFVHNGFVYLFGDADTGIIREFTWSPDDPHALTPTGRDIRLTRDGVDIAPHPTGLTHHPDFGYLLGDTVRQTGLIFHLDFDRALRDGNLDHAVLHTVVDDLAHNGTRPEFVTRQGLPMVATADYGNAANAGRLYDPAALLTASRTSNRGVLVDEWPAGPFVQSLRWLPARNAAQPSDRHANLPREGTLVLVQNITAGQGYRLTPVVLGVTDDLTDFPPCDMAETQRELEGFAPLPGHDAPAILFSAHREHNVTFADFSISP